MTATAKVFVTGNSQAIRLPKAFRVDVEEMWISRDELTGAITLMPKDATQLRQQRLDALIAAIAENPLPDSFLAEETRRNDPPQSPLQSWLAAPSAASRRRSATAKGTAKGIAKDGS